jgi:hypothetical protein
MAWSLLQLTGPDLPDAFLGDYAQRGIVMSLTYIDQAKRQRRTINGDLKDVSRAQFRKAAVTIQCSDVESPRLFEVPPGTLVGVVCVPELGSNGTETDGNPVQLAFNMMVMDWQATRDENNAESGWQMSLQEV